MNSHFKTYYARFSFAIFIFIVSFLMTQCKTKKLVVVEEIKVKNLAYLAVIDSLKTHYCKFSWLNSKANARFIINQNENEVKANIKMHTDSATWVSLSKMGVPAFTGVVSKDSVKFLTKVGAKQYFMDEFSKINEVLAAEIDYTILEDFFKGQPIAFDTNEVYKLASDNGLLLLSTEKSKRIDKMLKKNRSKGDTLLYRCWITPVSYKCSRIIINLISDQVSLEVNYSNWVDIDGCLFPMKSTLELKSPNSRIFIEMDYLKVEFNIPQEMPFNFTDSYIKIELTDLIGE
jgi:hypothetical protein